MLLLHIFLVGACHCSSDYQFTDDGSFGQPYESEYTKSLDNPFGITLIDPSTSSTPSVSSGSGQDDGRNPKAGHPTYFHHTISEYDGIQKRDAGCTLPNRLKRKLPNETTNDRPSPSGSGSSSHVTSTYDSQVYPFDQYLRPRLYESLPAFNLNGDSSYFSSEILPQDYSAAPQLRVSLCQIATENREARDYISYRAGSTKPLPRLPPVPSAAFRSFNAASYTVDKCFGIVLSDEGYEVMSAFFNSAEPSSRHYRFRTCAAARQDAHGWIINCPFSPIDLFSKLSPKDQQIATPRREEEWMEKLLELVRHSELKKLRIPTVGKDCIDLWNIMLLIIYLRKQTQDGNVPHWIRGDSVLDWPVNRFTALMFLAVISPYQKKMELNAVDFSGVYAKVHQVLDELIKNFN